MRSRRPSARPGDVCNSLSVCITTNTLEAGGAERQRVLLANELQQLGHKVTICCFQKLGDLAHGVDSDVRLELCDFRSKAGPFDVVISGTTNTEIFFAARHKASGLTRGWLCVVHNPVHPLSPKLALFARLGINYADAVAALTPQHASAMLKHWKLRATHLLPNGLDVDGEAHRVGVRAPHYNLGFIGRLDCYHKGLDRFVRALATIDADEWRVAIAGHGRDEGALRDHCRDLGISERVDFVGHQAPETFLADIGCLVLLSRYEAQPMVLLEAQAMNTPVVASAATGAVADERVTVVRDAAGTFEVAKVLRSRLHSVYSGKADAPMTSNQMAQGYEEVMLELARRPSSLSGLMRRLKASGSP